MLIIAKRYEGPRRVFRRWPEAFRHRRLLHPLFSVFLFCFVYASCSSATGVEPDWSVELPFNQVDKVAVVSDAVFCLGSDSDMSYGYAPCRMVIYSAATGTERFHTILDLRALKTVDDAPASGAFVLVEGTTAVVMSDSGRLRAFEATSGREIWAAEDVEHVLGSGGGYVFAWDRGSKLAAFDARTGVRSSGNASPSFSREIFRTASALGVTGRVFVATGQSLCAVDVPGWRERWIQPFESTRTDIQFASGFVIATGRNGWQVFNADTGALLWRFEAYETQRPVPPSILGDALFTMRGRASNSEVEHGYLRVYELGTGALRTRYAMAELPEPDGIVAANGRLYMAATEPHYGFLRRPLVESSSGADLANSLDCRPAAVDPASGERIWTGEPASWGTMAPLSISEDGFVAVAAMTPKRNKPARLAGYRPVLAR